MANYNDFLIVIFFYSLAILCHQGYCTLPVKVSPIVVDITTNNTCPSQNNIDAEVNASKEEIRQAIRNIINPLLDRGYTLAESCANTLGWTKVAFLNMSDPDEVCPPGLFLQTAPVRGCRQQSNVVSTCNSVIFALSNRRYSNVCGKVLAYQKGSTDAFYNNIGRGQTTIESAYVDGISLTHGPAGSRQHIWTFAAALYEQDPGYQVKYNCPCTNTQYNWTYQLPSFVQNNYFCDTGNPGPGFVFSTIYSADPLWDGDGCGPFNTCCQLNNPPWFHTALPHTTGDNIELRLCHGEESSNEDTIINLVEIYVK